MAQVQYKVSANHVDAKWQLADAIVSVDYHDYRSYGGEEEYSVTLPRFGCGKSYPNAESAIRGLLYANGCTSVVISKV